MSARKRKYKAYPTYKNGVDYDRTIDYKAEMEKAKEEGDLQRLAELEDKRNKKIDGEGFKNIRKTYDYTDIGTKIEAGIRDGADPAEIKELSSARRDKATQSSAYAPYKNDEIQKKALRYYYNISSGAGEDYENRPERENGDTYADEIRDLLKRVSDKNESEFTYNPENDEVYKALKNQMENESRRAATDVLASVGSQSGGKSSYAVSAAMQAANTYNAKLAEELPRLYELAYKRYTDGREDDRKALELSLKAAEAEENRYQSDLKQYNADREFAESTYAAELDRLSDEDRETAEREKEEADRSLKRELSEAELEAKAAENAAELVRYYEQRGIPAGDELLALAKMEGLSEQNLKSAEGYRAEAELAEELKRSQIAGNNAKTQKALTSSNGSKTSSKASSKGSADTSSKAEAETKTQNQNQTQNQTQTDAEAKAEKISQMVGPPTKGYLESMRVYSVTNKKKYANDGELTIIIGRNAYRKDEVLAGLKDGSFKYEKDGDGEKLVGTAKRKVLDWFGF